VEKMMRDAARPETHDDCGASIGGIARRGRIRGDAGQALVELALIMPIFSLLLLGAAEFGQVTYDAIEVSNAARAGVAYGVQPAATTAGIQAAAIADAPNIPNPPGLTVTSNTFCTCSGDPGSAHVPCTSAPATCSASGAHALTYIQVNTSATVTPLVHYPGISGGFALNGQAIMRVE
jgi:Flp pilus assembly protein TadG